MKEYTTGNAKVDQMGQMQISGNIIPQIWYKTITRKNGKPHLLAIAILSDIVYWYRPTEIRDESSGHITGYGKRFKWDMLQRSYDQFADFFGESKRSVTEAVVLLESLGVIRRDFRTINIGGIKYNNVLFIDLFPEQLYKLTYPEKGETEECTPCPEIQGEGAQNYGTGGTEECTPCPEIQGEGAQNFGTRNTKNTTENITEITTEITSSSSSLPLAGLNADNDDHEQHRQERIRECRMAALEGGCAPKLVDAVAVELQKYDQLLPPPMFLKLCRDISNHAPGDISNMSAYIRKCIANMILTQKLSEANAAHRIRAENTLLQRGYGVADWEAFERSILSN